MDNANIDQIMDPHELIQRFTLEDTPIIYENLETVQEHAKMCPECNTKLANFGLVSILPADLLERLEQEIDEDEAN